MEHVNSFCCKNLYKPGVSGRGSLIRIKDGRISEIIETDDVSGCEFNASRLNAAPGFVDLHIQGCGGSDFLDATPEAVRTIRKTALKGGCTSLLATCTFDNEENAFDRLENMTDAIREGSKGSGARIIGIHLEGPWLNIEKQGGFGNKYFRSPTPEDFAKVCDIVGDDLKMITIAPELPGAKEVISEAVKKGIVVALGHTTVDFDGAMEAFNLGADHMTHLFNAMTGLHHRNPGPIGAAFIRNDVFVQIIPDGIHIHQSVLKIIFRQKGPERICLITDATAPCGLPEGTELQGVGGTIKVKDGGVRLPDGTLAGSALLMDEAVRRMHDLAEIPLEATLEMASLTPACAIRMQDSIGKAEAGYMADFVLFDDELNIHYVIKEGELYDLKS